MHANNADLNSTSIMVFVLRNVGMETNSFYNVTMGTTMMEMDAVEIAR